MFIFVQLPISEHWETLKPLCRVLWATVNSISIGEILFPNLMSYSLRPRVAQFPSEQC